MRCVLGLGVGGRRYDVASDTEMCGWQVARLVAKSAVSWLSQKSVFGLDPEHSWIVCFSFSLWTLFSRAFSLSRALSFFRWLL